METSSSIPEAGVGEEYVEAPVCRHEWVIDSPNGPTSKGECRVCGEERHFQNHIEGSSWGYDVSLEQLSGSSRIPTSTNLRDHKSLAEDE